MARETPQSWGLECCFACHKPMRTPLHLLQARHMGLYKIHRACYTPELFSQLETEHLILIGPRNYEEVDRPRAVANKGDPKQPDLFSDA